MKEIDKIQNGLNYAQFYTAFLNAFRIDHPNSTAPKDTLINIFYDDYCNGMIIPSY